MADNKVVILTGASRGIGLAIAHYLLKKQHRLVVLSRSQKPLDDLSAQYQGQVKVLAGNAADFTLGKKAVELALREWKKIDGLVVNHGVLDPVQRVADCTAKDWSKAFDINLHSAVGMVQAALPELRKTKGCIVMTSSGAATKAYTAWGAYGASKAAMNHLALTLSVEEPDVTTVSIRPGIVDTEMQRDLREKHHETMDTKDAAKFAELKSTGALLKPEQPGYVIAKLVLGAPKELSGKSMTWNAEELKVFQEC